MDPEIWREAAEPPVLTEEGSALVGGGPEEGGYRILDARVAAMESHPTIFEDTRILTISDEIPNDTLSYGPGFPLAVAQEINDAVIAYTSSEACQEPPAGTVTLCSEAFYNWTGAEEVLDSSFDPVRNMIAASGMTEEEILGE
jgi:phosphonate transport system substrate-binding protein